MSSQKVRTNNANFLRTHFLYDITGFHYLCRDKKLFYEKNYLILITAVNRACILSRPVSEEKHQSGDTGRTLHQRSGTNGIYLAL